MRSSAPSNRAHNRGVFPSRPVPASRAPHASTAKVDSSELRNPSAIYTQAEILARQHTPPVAVSTSSIQGRRFSTATSTSSPVASPSAASQTLARISDLAPHASGSSSTLFRTVLKTPALTQLYMHGSFSSNAPDVLRQFTAELRFFQTVRRHKNIVAFVGSLESVGMLLEYLEGETLWSYLGKGIRPSVRADWWNQILAGVCHIHSFGLAHNDLCTLNIIITKSGPSSSSKSTISRPTRYVVKLIDFGRSSAEPRPAPIQSALAALRNIPSTAMSSIPSQEDRARETPAHEQDLIYPGTRPFASPEIMRAWKCSNAGANSPVDGDTEDGSETESDGEVPVRQEVEMRRPAQILPLPLSTPAYGRETNDAYNAGPSGMRQHPQLPILSFTDNSPTRPSTSSDTPTRSSLPRGPPGAPTYSHVIDRGSLSHSHARAYPSPTSSPSGSQPSSPSSRHHYAPLNFPHDDADSSFISPPISDSPVTYSNSTSRLRTEKRNRSRQLRRAQLAQKVEALHSMDPRPLSPMLGDTYSLGVLALCIDLDELVDVEPSVQMCEEWDWRVLAMERGGLKIFAGGLSKGRPVERYLRSVKTRERCKLSDAVDTEQMRQYEREEDIAARAKAAGGTVVLADAVDMVPAVY